MNVPFDHVNAVYGLTEMLVASSNVMYISVGLYSRPD